MLAPETIVACRSPLSKAVELVVAGPQTRDFRPEQSECPECCRANYNLLLKAVPFAYALRGEKGSDSAPQAVRFVTARIPGAPNAVRCWTISLPSRESCPGAAKLARRDFIRACCRFVL